MCLEQSEQGEREVAVGDEFWELWEIGLYAKDSGILREQTGEPLQDFEPRSHSLIYLSKAALYCLANKL